MTAENKHRKLKLKLKLFWYMYMYMIKYTRVKIGFKCNMENNTLLKIFFSSFVYGARCTMSSLVCHLIGPSASRCFFSSNCVLVWIIKVYIELIYVCSYTFVLYEIYIQIKRTTSKRITSGTMGNDFVHFFYTLILLLYIYIDKKITILWAYIVLLGSCARKESFFNVNMFRRIV